MFVVVIKKPGVEKKGGVGREPMSGPKKKKHKKHHCTTTEEGKRRKGGKKGC